MNRKVLDRVRKSSMKAEAAVGVLLASLMIIVNPLVSIPIIVMKGYNILKLRADKTASKLMNLTNIFDDIFWVIVSCVAAVFCPFFLGFILIAWRVTMLVINLRKRGKANEDKNNSKTN